MCLCNCVIVRLVGAIQNEADTVFFPVDSEIFHFYCLLALPFGYDSLQCIYCVSPSVTWIFWIRNEQTKEVYFICNSASYYAPFKVNLPAIRRCSLLNKFILRIKSVDHGEQWQKFIISWRFFFLLDRRHECAFREFPRVKKTFKYFCITLFLFSSYVSWLYSTTVNWMFHAWNELV